MPDLGGITAWISAGGAGEQRLEEYDVHIDDDKATCFIEVPSIRPDLGISPSPPPSRGGKAAGPPLDPTNYAINYRITDLTYTLVVKTSIDGAIDVDKVHAGRGALVPAKNVGSIEAVAVTDDWSKKRRLKFHKLTASLEGESPPDELGTITVSFYRAGRPNFGVGNKSVATGFHKESSIDPRDLITSTDEDGLKFRSHATGLGPIEFGPPKKVLAVKEMDAQPYVSFTFQYRSRDLLPEEWFRIPNFPPPPTATSAQHPNYEKDLPTPTGEHERDYSGAASSGYRPHSPHVAPDYQGGAPLQKRTSITGSAKKWAEGVKRGASTIRFPRRNRTKVEVTHPPSTWTGAERVPNIETARAAAAANGIEVEHRDGFSPTTATEGGDHEQGDAGHDEEYEGRGNAA